MTQAVCTLYQIIHCFVETALDARVAELQYTFWKLQRLLARGLPSWRMKDKKLCGLKCYLKTIIGPFTIGCVYRPPDSDSSLLASSLEQSLKNTHSSTVILTGDFNAGCRKWFEPDRTDFCREKIAELFHTYSLEQKVNFRTNFSRSAKSMYGPNCH